MLHCNQPKFNINDELLHVSARCRDQFFVVSVQTETCPGGTQHHYHCRMFLRGSMCTELVRINETELRRATPEELDAETRSAFAVWCDTRKESAVSDKQFEVAKGFMELRKAMEMLTAIQAKETT